MSELQFELETVIDHPKYYSAYPITKESIEKAEVMLEAFMPGILRKEDTNKPRPIRAKELGITYEAFCASSGRQLAKMLSQYDDSPSSQLWSDIQRLAREILK